MQVWWNEREEREAGEVMAGEILTEKGGNCGENQHKGGADGYISELWILRTTKMMIV